MCHWTYLGWHADTVVYMAPCWLRASEFSLEAFLSVQTLWRPTNKKKTERRGVRSSPLGMRWLLYKWTQRSYACKITYAKCKNKSSNFCSNSSIQHEGTLMATSPNWGAACSILLLGDGHFGSGCPLINCHCPVDDITPIWLL